MTVLHIEHAVADFDAWKQAFDADPVGRSRSGVTRYRILRASDDPSFVMIDLEFGTEAEARSMLRALQGLWTKVTGTLIGAPSATIAESVETVTL